MAWADPQDTQNPAIGAAIQAAWGDAVNASVQWLAGDSTNPKPSCRVYNSGSQTIANNTVTAITFDSERFDNGAMHSTSSNTSRLTVPAGGGGVFLIGGNIVWASNATGVRSLQIRVNGATTVIVQDNISLSANTCAMTISGIYALAATDYVELMVYQNSGGTLNVTAVANYSPEIYAMWMSL